MNKKLYKLLVFIILLMVVSCDEPETVVTNIVHADGSVTRKVEMRKKENKFQITDIQVPLDSTWAIADSIEISAKGDTIWVKRAEKLFKNVEEINLSYKTDTGCNSNLKRSARFSKKFRWFNTIYRFSEVIDKRFKHGYPVSDYLNKDELHWFYAPSSDHEAMLNGPDSLHYKAFSDTIEKKKNDWFYRSVVSEWRGEFSDQIQNIADKDLSPDTLKKKEDILVELMKSHEKDFDSLWQKGHILGNVIGESNALKYKIEADSALKIVEDRLLEDFAGYSVRISMPGRLISSNGFVDSTHMLVWPVSDDYFFTGEYEMWAESKTPNKWAWVVSGLFILFVFTGIVIRKNRKG